MAASAQTAKSNDKKPLSVEELGRMNGYWHACNYLAAGMIYLRENPLLREPLRPEHIKNRLLGHWGSDAGQSFVWVHLNRLIREQDLNMIYISGPGHGAPAILATAIWRALMRKFIRISGKTRRGCGSSSGSSHFREELGATARRRRRARSMKAASLATA